MPPSGFKLGPPKPSSHPVDVGLRTEAHILSELVRRGYSVLTPFGVNNRYDLVIDLDGRFLRAQCKTGRLRKGCVKFPTRSIRSNTTETFVEDYRGQIELFLVFCPETSTIYAVPVNDAPGSYGFLRVDAPRNSQRARIRWASEYALPG